MATKKTAGNQWEFSVPGNNNKLCKSISQIDESFKNTKGTDIVSKGNRYRSLLCKISDCSNLFDLITSEDVKDKAKLQKIREKFSKITQIVVSFDDVFYKLDGKFYGGSYLGYMPKMEGLKKYLDFKYEITKKIIQDKNSELSMYKKMGNEEAKNILHQDILQYAKTYVSLYRGRESLVGLKRIPDVFFEQSDFVFDSLRDIFIVDNSKNNTFDYMNIVNNSILVTNKEKIKEKNGIIDFNDELNCLQRYVKTLESAGTKYKNINRVYLIPEFLNASDFLSQIPKVELENYLVYEYIVPVKLEDAKKQAEIAEYLEKSRRLSNNCLSLIKKMNSLVQDGNLIVNASNPTEKSLWASYLALNSVKTSLEYLIQVIKGNKDDSFGNWLLENGNKLSLSSLFIVNSLNPEINSEEDIRYFLQYVPSYLFDDRKITKNKEMSTLEGSKKLYNQYIICYKLLFGILELFLGVQMGTLAIYMKRYGLQGMDFVLNLFPSIKNNNLLRTTPNVTKLAEYCLYKDLHVSAIESDKSYYGTVYGKELLGPFEGFAMKAFKKLAEFTKVDSDFVLTHTDKEDSKNTKISNLLIVLGFVESMFKEYHAFFHMD